MPVEKTLENIEKCMCMQCPSYTYHCKMKNAAENFLQLMEDFPNNQHYEKLFCAYEPSHCLRQKYGCLCSICEVSKKNNLHRQSYCLYAGGQ